MTEFQPTLPAELPFSDAEMSFLDEQPPRLYPENQNSNFGFTIRKIFSDQIQTLINQLDTLFNEKFVNTSVQFLDEWEKQVGLPTNPTGYTTAQRRVAILNRLRKGPFTRTARRLIVESFIIETFGAAPQFVGSGIPIDSSGIALFSDTTSLAGTYNIVEHISSFTYDVRILNTITIDQVGLTRELNRITPAHIGFSIIMTATP